MFRSVSTRPVTFLGVKMAGTVEDLKSSADSVKSYLMEKGEISLVNTAEDVWRKSVLIAAASYFEHELGKAIGRSIAAHDVPTQFQSLIDSKAVSRQFYSYFDFNSANTNKLFNSFGANCKEKAEAEIKASGELKEAQKGFLEVCSLRNQMVHSNYAAFSIDLTTDEIYEKYQKGRKFLEFFEKLITNLGRQTMRPAEL